MFFENSSEEADWYAEVVKQKHFANIMTAKDLASYYILSKAHTHKYASPSIDDYEKIKAYTSEVMPQASSEFLNYMKNMTRAILSQINPVTSAHAQTVHERGGIITSVGKYEELAIAQSVSIAAGFGTVWGLGFVSPVKKLLQKLSTPVGRIIIGSVLAIWASAMAIHTANQMEHSKKRAKKLRELGDSFVMSEGALGHCRSADRNDPSKPSCYCYTPENARNPRRANSRICNDLEKERNFAKGDYFKGKTPLGCIDRNRQSDPKCACKKSSKGCMKVTPTNFPGMSLGTFRMLASGLSPLNSIADGSFDAGRANASGMVQQASRIMAANKKMMNDKRFKGLGKKVDQEVAAIQRDVAKGLSSLPPQNSAPRPLPTTPAEAAAALEKEFKEADDQIKKASAPDSAAPAPTPAEARPEFGMTEEDLSTQEGQLAEAMNQDLDYGQSDISTEQRNIFEVLSNRYQRSGLRRLFDESGAPQIDKPAESDIAP
jgi:hypothetical protein